MIPLLFDPLDAPPGAWPVPSPERGYIEGVAEAGVSILVRNLHTRWLAVRSGERVLPLTVNDGEVGEAYVCLPHSAYVLYGRDELDLVDVGILDWPCRMALRLLGGLLLRANLNKTAIVDNWLLSTNLHGDWTGEDLPAIRALLQSRFPDHVIGLRSLDPWSCPALLEAARRDGWRLVPSRQIWVTDDPDRNWRRRHSTRNDLRLMQRLPLVPEDMEEMSDADADRIADLYRQLYIGKYSALNPIFTAAFITLTHQLDMLRYRAARDGAGRIMAVVGTFTRHGVLTPPIVGYDMSRPRSEGLYRVASCLFSEAAVQSGARLHNSSGAGHFKRMRGARNEIEYWAMHVGHLSAFRRWTVAALERLLTLVIVPMMKRRGL